MIIITLKTNEKFSGQWGPNSSLYSVSATLLVCGFDDNDNDSLDEIKVI